MTRSGLPRSARGIGFLLVLCLFDAVLATSPLPPASLYGSLLSNLSRPYEHDAFVQLAAPYLVRPTPHTPHPTRSQAQHDLRGWPELNSPITRNGSFSFTDLKVAEYVLSVHSRLAEFQFYAVNVTPSHQVDVRLYLPGQGPTRTKPFAQPLLLPAVHLKSYTTLPTPFSPLRLLRSNPSLLLGGLALVALALLPKLLARLDPETAREVNQSQADLHAKLAAFANLGGGRGGGGGGPNGSDELTKSLSKRLAKTKTSLEEQDGVQVEGIQDMLSTSLTSGAKQNQEGMQTGKGKGGKKRK
ncbi:BZ3500_MvSof-1268-A1-R1_Chr2-2g04812 [Microbotryum saponariae]|uniref:BZ3500_MvSof-1268-A1-R1_Chr2-2g04812 protein n=1 Tax=Microbotryum saponariae TaxID=289078 RepID=A0A2X0N003_9BASI|nr:BZ3500_MvSof-1268-A1-R1_Chr2-2g04812 [Microbotryum saponariae]SDA00222.1 BZ3501_MvSof-1269-A2-R1_Chr2-2g04486 [Microbotryum saponariae]